MLRWLTNLALVGAAGLLGFWLYLQAWNDQPMWPEADRRDLVEGALLVTLVASVMARRVGMVTYGTMTGPLRRRFWWVVAVMALGVALAFLTGIVEPLRAHRHASLIVAYVILALGVGGGLYVNNQIAPRRAPDPA